MTVVDPSYTCFLSRVFRPLLPEISNLASFFQTYNMPKDRGQAVVEPLSPRSTNIASKPRALQKKVVEQEAAKTTKQKDHASPPPSLVIQPPEAHDDVAVQYRTGRLLGKGGFAICYEGQRQGKHGVQTYALKIVKASMAQKKLEDKVSLLNVGNLDKQG